MRNYLRTLSPLFLVLTLGTSMSTAQVLSLDGDDGVSLGDTTVTVGGESDSDALVDVDANGDRTDVDVLPGGGGSDSEVIVRLFGNSGGGTTATVGVTQGSTNPANAEVELFGGGSATGESSATVELFGPGSNGSDGSGGGAGGNGSVAAAGGSGGAAGTRLATTAKAGSCFAPNPAHLENLLSRNSSSAANSISRVTDANVVSVDICPDARTRLSQAVAADADSSSIRSAVSANPHIVLALNNAGKRPADVLSVDINGSEATVYVY